MFTCTFFIAQANLKLKDILTFMKYFETCHVVIFEFFYVSNLRRAFVGDLTTWMILLVEKGAYLAST